MKRDRACNGFAETGVQFELICSLGWEILFRLKNAPGAHNERALRAPRHRNRYALLALAYVNIGGVQSSLPWDVHFTRWELIARQQAAEPATISVIWAARLDAFCRRIGRSLGLTTRDFVRSAGAPGSLAPWSPPLVVSRNKDTGERHPPPRG